MKKELLVTTLIMFLFLQCEYKPTERQKEEQQQLSQENVLKKDLNMIIGEHWSSYKYRSHYKILYDSDESTTFERGIPDKTNSYYVFSHYIQVRNDSVIKEGYNLEYNYDDFIKLDNHLLEYKPTVFGDFTPEGNFMLRTYAFKTFQVQISLQRGNYSIHYMLY